MRFLRLNLTSRLDWNPHINDLWNRCQCPLKIISGLRHTWWGADLRLLRSVYFALIRSRIDYGSFLFNGITKLQRVRLDRIQFRALRLSMGLRLSSPTNFILGEAKDPPIYLRTEYLCRSFLSRVFTQINHPLLKILEVSNEVADVQQSALGTLCPLKDPILLRTFRSISEKMKFLEKDCIPLCYKTEFASTVFIPEVDLTTGLNFDKDSNCESLFFDIFEYEIRNSVCLYTDGSRVPGSEFSGYAVVTLDESVSSCTKAPGFFIFTLETLAI